MSLHRNIQDILPQIAERAERAEREAKVPAENIALLAQAGFFRALQPQAYGGLELDIPEYASAIIALAQGCASTAWACGLLANHAHAIALFSEQLQQDIWGAQPDALIASSVAPSGQWCKAEGGIYLSGTFGWSSGCDYADWAVLGYMGENKVGQPGPCFAVVPKADYRILDDWDSAALKGTGSKSLRLEEVFVPDYRCESLFALNYGLSRGYQSQPGHLYYLPFSPVFSLGFAAVSVGIAKRCTQVFIGKTKGRVRAYTQAQVSDSAAIHIRLAESVNQVTSAEILLQSDWQQMSACSKQLQLPMPDQVLNWRCHQAYAAKLAIAAVDRIFQAAGGSAWFNNNEMQRLFRDVHITGSHAQTDYDIAAQTLGRHLLGLPMEGKYY